MVMRRRNKLEYVGFERSDEDGVNIATFARAFMVDEDTSFANEASYLKNASYDERNSLIPLTPQPVVPVNRV